MIFSPFYKFTHKLNQFADLVYSKYDHEKLILLLYLFVLNNHHDKNTSLLVKKLAEIVTKEKMEASEVKYQKFLKKCVFFLLTNTNFNNDKRQHLDQLDDILKTITIPHSQSTHQAVSNENIFVRDCLKSVVGEGNFEEETYQLDGMIRPDFYVPKARLMVEINGKSKYYPYTTKYNNFLNLNHKLTLQNNFNVIYLKSWVLEGMMQADDGKDQLKDLLAKTIETYKASVK